jgi:hypothetical protein
MGCLGTLLQYTYAVKYWRGGTAGLESPAKDTSPKARKTRSASRDAWMFSAKSECLRLAQ